MFIKLLQTWCIASVSLSDHFLSSNVHRKRKMLPTRNISLRSLTGAGVLMSHPPLREENLISVILRDYKLNPHTNTRRIHGL